MTDQINTRDRERLSAYLDGMLEGPEARTLERRLDAEPELTGALARLKRTRYLLRRVPQAQAPRAFTLTAEMVGGGSSSWLDRLPFSLTMVSAMASILLLVFALGDFLTPGGLISIDDLRAGSAQSAEFSTAADAETEPLALAAPAEEESLESQAAELDSPEEQTGEEAAVLPAGADESMEDQATDDDSGERLIEAQEPEDTASVRRLHLFLVDAVLALIALVSGLGAWLQRRSS